MGEFHIFQGQYQLFWLHNQRDELFVGFGNLNGKISPVAESRVCPETARKRQWNTIVED